MQVTTTYNDPKVITSKPFSWSYSKLKNFEACPKKHWHVDLAKDFKEEESDNLREGNALHSVAAKRLGEKKEPLPPGYEHIEKWVQKILYSKGTVLVEQKLAITAGLGPCKYFDKAAWYRGVADAIVLKGPAALAIDWKTGKIVEDSVQLGLMAACVFAHHPEVQAVRTEFIWLKYDASSRCDFWRKDMPAFWSALWPRISALEQAYKLTHYPAKQGGLCRNWCPVQSCVHFGGN